LDHAPAPPAAAEVVDVGGHLVDGHQFEFRRAAEQRASWLDLASQLDLVDQRYLDLPVKYPR